MRILAVYSIKGGVGKTASAVNLAYLASRRAPTALWDLDPQGAASFTFRIHPSVAKGGTKRLFKSRRAVLDSLRGTDFADLDMLPSDFSYRHLDVLLDRSGKRRLARILKPLRREYDELFIDCAPGISLVSEHVFAVADALLVPIIPTVLSLRSLGRLVKHLRKGHGDRPRVLPFFTLVDRRKSMHRQVCDWAKGQVPWILRQEIPYATQVEQMGVERAPLEVFAQASPAAAAYRALWDEIGARLEQPRADRPAKQTIRGLLDRARDTGRRRRG